MILTNRAFCELDKILFVCVESDKIPLLCELKQLCKCLPVVGL